MKNTARLIMTFCLLSFYCISNAQVGINNDGSNADASAMLDIKSTDKGMLVPRMTTTQRTTLGNTAATALLVFDTDTNSFWFYNGMAWEELISGNVATISDADNNTKIEVEKNTNEDIIRFSTNGTEILNIEEDRLVFANTVSNIKIGKGAGYNTTSVANTFIGDSTGFHNTTGNNNIALGKHSLYTNTDGASNVALGNSALRKNTTGELNTALGTISLLSNIDGVFNVGVGYGAGGFNENGSGNVFIGGASGGYTNSEATDMSRNVMVGLGAGLNNGSNGNIFLGYSAGANEPDSNKLYIENSNADATNALIYGEFDNNMLRINGELNINNAFSLPSTDGTNGQILATDGSGTLSWTDQSSGDFIENRTPDNSEVGGQTASLDVRGTIETNTLRTNGNVTLGISGDPSPNTVSVNSNLEVNNTLKVGSNGGSITGMLKASITRDVGNINSNDTRTETFTVTGASVGGIAYVSPRAALGSRIVVAQVWVSGANTVSVRFRNVGGSGQNPPNTTYDIVVIQ